MAIADLTPEEFERDVMRRLEETGNLLHAFRVSHREQLDGIDGTYEIDIVARFESLGVEFTVLIECKHHAHPIKREVVQVLHDKIRSIGAHKGIIFSTAPYQSGAVRYAKAHGLALFWISEEVLGPIARNTGRTTTSRQERKLAPIQERELRLILRSLSRCYQLLTLSDGGEVQLSKLKPCELRSLLGLVKQRLLLPPCEEGRYG